MAEWNSWIDRLSYVRSPEVSSRQRHSWINSVKLNEIHIEWNVWWQQKRCSKWPIRIPTNWWYVLTSLSSRWMSHCLCFLYVKVVFRHRAHKIASEITNKMLGSLRLGQLFNAVLLKNNEETTALLKLVEPYVTWGYPSINTVRELIFKHGFLRIESKKVAIDSNKLIEDHLGESGVICIEDIVHELFHVSDNFDKIKEFLLPFKVGAAEWLCDDFLC